MINHIAKTLRIVALSVHRQGDEDLAAAYEVAVARIQELFEKLNQRGVSELRLEVGRAQGCARAPIFFLVRSRIQSDPH